MTFRSYARTVLGVNLFVILWGAYVRASESGAGCGRHWPLCNGTVVPQAPATATMIEFIHRVTSGLAVVLVVGLAWWAWRAFPPGSRVRKAAAWSLLFIITEALIGAGLVLLGLVGPDDSLGRAGYLAAHLCNTFLLLAALALTIHWSGNTAARQSPSSGAAAWLLGTGLGLILLLGMSGAVAALGDTLFPSTSLAQGFRADTSPTASLLIRLRVLHPVLALLSGIYLSAMVWLVSRLRPASLYSVWGRVVSALVLVQLGVGLTNLLLLAPTPMQLAHLLTADLLWMAQVLYTASALTAPPRARAAAAPA